ncbi:MAG: ZIP family metal transporter [Acidobacteria bacterium]|nr:ZIP family metal transporter [Acidobacteriota bacterium]
MDPFIQLVSFGLLAAGGNLLGGFLITKSQETRQTKLRYLIAVGAGFMLAAVFLEVIPEVARQWDGQLGVAMSWLLAGYLLIQLAEHTVAPHFHFGEEIHTEEMLRRGAATTAVIALSVHTFFDGVAIASGLLTSFRLGFLIFIAILLHKVPEGFTVASIMLSSGRGTRAAWHATLLIAAATFAGILSVTLVKPAVIYTLPFSAGVTLYVAASDLIPEVNHSGGTRTSLLIFAGVALFYLTHLILHEALGE